MRIFFARINIVLVVIAPETPPNSVCVCVYLVVVHTESDRWTRTSRSVRSLWHWRTKLVPFYWQMATDQKRTTSQKNRDWRSRPLENVFVSCACWPRRLSVRPVERERQRARPFRFIYWPICASLIPTRLLIENSHVKQDEKLWPPHTYVPFQKIVRTETKKDRRT